MTQRSSPVETSLLYPAKSAPIEQIDVSALHRLLTMLDVTPNHIRTHNSDYILIDCAAFEAVIVGCDVAFPQDHFDGAVYPGEATPVGKTIRADLAGHQSSLTVIVVDKHSSSGHNPDVDLTRRVGWHMLYLLMEMTHPELVFWCEDDRLMTPQMATEAVKEFHRATPFSFAAKGAHGAPVAAVAADHPPEAVLVAAAVPDALADHAVQFEKEPALSSDVLAWFHKPKAVGAKADAQSDAQSGAQSDAQPDAQSMVGLPGVGEWLRRMSHTSRATIALSVATATLGLFSLPIKASAALGKLF